MSLIAVFAEGVVAVRFLGDDYATFILATVVVAFMAMLADFGMKSAITQAVAAAEPSERAGFVASALAMRVAAVLVISLLAWPAKGVIENVIGSDFDNAAWLVVAMFVATTFEELLVASLRGYEAHRAIAVLQVVRATVRLGVTTGLLIADWGPEALAVSWALAYGVAAIGAFIALPDRGIWLDVVKLRALISFGGRAQLTRVLRYAVTFLPVFVLSRLSTKAAVAAFAVALRIPSGIQTLTDAFSTVYYPKMSSLLARKRRFEAKTLLVRSVAVSTIALGFGTVVVAAIGAPVLELLFGSEYREAGGTFTLLILALALGAPNTIMGFALSSARRPAGPALLGFVAAVVLLPVEWALVDSADFRAPAIAMVVAEVAVLPVTAWLLARAGLEFNWPPFLAQLALTGLATGVVTLLTIWVGATGMVLAIPVAVAYLGVTAQVWRSELLVSSLVTGRRHG